jgi:endonuclease/exonuclease/phosphatase family metal-dependent hydrolase
MATGAPTRRPWPPLVEFGLPALTVAFGLQLLRLEIATVISVERDRLGASITALAGFALGSLLLAFLAPVVVRALGPRLAVAICGGGVALVRLAVQLLPDALARWLVAPLGVILFCWFVPSYLAAVRGTRAGRRLGVSVLLGFALDTAVLGAAGVYDPVWRITPATIALVALLGAAQLGLLARFLRGSAAGGRRGEATRAGPLGAPASLATTVRSPTAGARVITGGAGAASGVAWAAVPLAGFGAALFLQSLVLQNVGWQAVFGRLTDTRAFLVVMLANLVALAVGGLLTAAPRRPGWVVTLAAIAAVAASVALQRRAGVVALFCGQAGLAVLLVGIFRRACQPGARPVPGGTAPVRTGPGRIGGSWALGMLLFGLLLFLYYAVYDVVLPFDNKVLFPVAAGLLAAAGATARLAGAREEAGSRSPSERSAGGRRGDRAALVVPVALGLVLLLAPAGLSLTTPSPAAAAASGYPVRVMSYNLHFGFDVEGWSRLEQTARAIESSGATVVGLEEMSRGWYINGSTDMLSWLQRRLRMPYLVFGGASDPIWGNAILSRRPITASGVVPLPRQGVPLRRNYLWATVDLGGGQTLRVISTHLHQVEGPEGAPVRLAQMPKLLDGWARAPATVVMGDFNATPGSGEVALLTGAGLHDAWTEAGSPHGDELTYASNRPYERIDYLWLSPDLHATAFAATTTTASDHRGIAATLTR